MEVLIDTETGSVSGEDGKLSGFKVHKNEKARSENGTGLIVQSCPALRPPIIPRKLLQSFLLQRRQPERRSLRS
jgi:hypothetical protein